METLEKEFESSGRAAWINSDIYPDNKIHTREYTKWLEKQVFELRGKEKNSCNAKAENSRNETSEFKQFRRKEQFTELRPVTENDIKLFELDKHPHSIRETEFKVSISEADRVKGSPKIGDMIARNPKNHLDQWLVAKQYFEDNFEL
jgi:hypothetical protein